MLLSSSVQARRNNVKNQMKVRKTTKMLANKTITHRCNITSHSSSLVIIITMVISNNKGQVKNHLIPVLKPKSHSGNRPRNKKN